MDLNFLPPPSPHIADYIVIAIFLCACMGIGLYYGYRLNRNPTLENYFFGNRHLHLLPVSMSIFVTFISAISLMGVPAEVYVYGIRIVYYAVSYILSVTIANLTVIPLLHPLRLSSVFEYLELRFHSKTVRILGTLIGMLLIILDMSVTVYAPSLALEIVAGIPLWVSIVVIGLIAIIYTSIGGIKSVVWTDVFQFIMIFVGIAAVTIKGSVLMETCHGVIEIATAGRRLEFVNIDPDPRSRHTIWGTCIGLTFTFLSYWCNQSSFQRMSSLSSLRKTQLAFWLLCPMIIIYFILLGYLGILVYSYYNTVMCDPVEGGFLSNFNQLMPFFVLDVLRSLPGLSGVYISCLFSGTLSTLSSGINSMSAITVKDIFGTCVRHPTAISQTCAGKILVIVYGLIVIALAYVISSMSGSVIQIFAVVSGACGAGPLAGLFFLGGMVPKANWIGAIVGSLASIFCTSWLALGAQIYGTQPERLAHNPTSGCSVNNIKSVINKTQINKTTFDTYGLNGSSSVSPDGQVISYSSNAGFSLYDLSYTWYGFIGFLLTLIVGTIVSLCTGGDGGNSVETRLIFPIFRKVFGLHTDTIDETEEMREMKLPTTIKTDSKSEALAERVKPSDIPPRTNRSKTLGYQCDMYGLVHPIAINGTPTMEND